MKKSKNRYSGKRHRKKPGKQKNGGLLLLALAAAAAVLLVLVLILRDQDTDGTQTADAGDDSSNQGYITYQGEKYEYNSGLKTMLFMGVDKDEKATLRDVTGYSGQSDCLILLVLDQHEENITLIEIPRDSMVNVSVYGENGDFLSTVYAQLAIQYAYGKGEKDSCRLTKQLVSDLFYNIRINDYLSLNMAGIAPIVDAIGGVEITVPEDYTDIDPAFEKGATLTLNGEQAEKYVRKRDITVLGSNLMRMERQTQFIQALFEKLSEADDGGMQMLRQFWSAGEDYMTTNLDLSTMEKLMSYTVEPEIIKVEGEIREGEEHDEFYVDEDALRQMVIDIFYKKMNDSVTDS